jgi:hypothetical protein
VKFTFTADRHRIFLVCPRILFVALFFVLSVGFAVWEIKGLIAWQETKGKDGLFPSNYQ